MGRVGKVKEMHVHKHRYGPRPIWRVLLLLCLSREHLQRFQQRRNLICYFKSVIMTVILRITCNIVSEKLVKQIRRIFQQSSEDSEYFLKIRSIYLLVQSLRHVQLLQRYGLLPSRLLCPLDSPGKDTGAGCHFPLRGLSNPGIEP